LTIKLRNSRLLVLSSSNESALGRERAADRDGGFELELELERHPIVVDDLNSPVESVERFQGKYA